MAFGKCGPCKTCGKTMKYQGGQCTCMNPKCAEYLVEKPAQSSKATVDELAPGSEEV